MSLLAQWTRRDWRGWRSQPDQQDRTFARGPTAAAPIRCGFVRAPFSRSGKQLNFTTTVWGAIDEDISKPVG